MKFLKLNREEKSTKRKVKSEIKIGHFIRLTVTAHMYCTGVQLTSV